LCEVARRCIEKNEKIANLGDMILDVIGKNIDICGETQRIKASIGFSVYPRDGKDTETLMKKADAAMYIAKASDKEELFHLQGAR
jgi:diguanylate cyclase (GGDEF)-like protein